MSEHTPGPWGIEQTNNCNWIGPMRRAPSRKVKELVVHTDREGLTIDALAKSDANARLIAAAPDLLEACKRNAQRMGSARETLEQTQPGMPTLPHEWRDWFLRQIAATCGCADNAISKAAPTP